MEDDSFMRELCWCIDQLELGLEKQNPSSNQAKETAKVLNILKSSKAPLVKKRQAMRNTFGDYRAKMKSAEKKGVNKIQKTKGVSPVKSVSKKSMFYKKCTKQSEFLLKDRVKNNEDRENPSSSLFQPVKNSFQFSFPANDLDTNTDQTLNKNQTGTGCDQCTEEDIEPCSSETRIQSGFTWEPSKQEFKFNFDAKGD